MQFATNQKGFPSLLWNGYRYNKNTRTNFNSTTIWRCVKRQICSASITLDCEQNIVRSSVHSCEPDQKRNKVFQLRAECKQKVCEDLSSTVQTIVENTFEPLKESEESAEYVHYIPSTKEIQDSLYRARKKFLDTDSLKYTKLEGVSVPEVLSKNFLVSDDGDSSKILIFCSKISRQYIKNTKLDYFGDGTFKCVPSPFFQLYTVHVDLGSTPTSTNVAPVIYGLLPDKTEGTYLRFFQLLGDILHVKMKSFKSDFEVAAINAVYKIFPNCQVSGCHYHYTRAIWKKAKQIKLSKIRSGRKILRLVSYIPLLPADRIAEAWNTILTLAPDYEEMISFKKYFERQWLTIFSPSLLSCYKLLHRTTNCLEGWHHRLNAKMGLHPSLFRFIFKLKKESKFYDHQITKSLFSEPKNNRRKCDIDFDIKLSILMRRVEKGQLSCIRFLRKIIFTRLKLT